MRETFFKFKWNLKEFREIRSISRGFKAIKGNLEKFEYKRNAKEVKEMQGYSKTLQGIQQNLREYKIIQEDSKEFNDFKWIIKKWKQYEYNKINEA